MPDRKLVTVEVVTGIYPITDATHISRARVRGWDVVVKSHEFQVGDQACYFELDSFLPLADPRFAFLEPRGSKVVDGVHGHVLKTARLRGTYSQGLILPASLFPELAGLGSGDDVAAALGIAKYEPPIPADLAGTVAGPFPTRFAPKTDAERVQNLTDDYDRLRAGHDWVATEKIDGTSVTMINDGGTLRVCGRNWEFAAPEKLDGTPAHWNLAESLGILELLPDGWAVQGELFGEGIQGNPLRIKGHRCAAFSVLADGSYIPRHEWPAALAGIAAPALEDLVLPETVEEAVAQADGLKSAISPDRLAEGIVWHAADGARLPELGDRSCFKAISNRYLLKHS